ncbi:carboxypeptidase [Rhizobium sp. TRM95111]|uniref:S10 family peptidase n=1 Tax=Rhizobium alarense TaxID=2846851 RepID=UPI001F26453F|nr:carboxypeptidase [Rhizobium alarense]MCF3640583.1 carboxypeptidase [Rhizobium alarense]
MLHRLSVVLLSAYLLLVPAAAQSPDSRATEAEGILSLLPADSSREFRLQLDGRSLPYAATAGTLALFGQDGKVSARLFYTAYVAKDAGADRPVTFVFNGGPGAASAYLHLGLVGPRLLPLDGGDSDGTRPALVDNADSWLAFTDLVLIDPVGTGWSRATTGDKASDFYGVREDAESIAKAITLYVQGAGRMASRKYLLGESYGGFRAAKVATALKDRQGILVSGIVMVSPLIDARLLFGATSYPLGAALQFPSLAAAELEREDRFNLERLKEAEAFAMGDYLVTLAGRPPSGVAADDFHDRIARFTGIEKAEVARSRGFVGDLYAAAAGDERIASPYDAGHSVPDPFPEERYVRGDDAVLDGYTRAYGAAFADYARNTLGFRTEMTYTLLSSDVSRQWDWNDGGGRGEAEAVSDLRNLLSVIPSFRLLVAHGYTDVLTPYGASRYVIDHLPAELAEAHASLALYRGGHMFYTRPESRRAFAKDAEAFFADDHPSE